MNGFLKQVMVLLSVLALITVPCTTCLAQELLEQDDDVIAGKMAAEVVVRPLGLAATVIGGAVFIVTSPFSLLGGNVEPAFNYLVADPFKFTFNRPLGDF
jgi:ABC-type molybdate transport system permease subunit